MYLLSLLRACCCESNSLSIVLDFDYRFASHIGGVLPVHIHAPDASLLPELECLRCCKLLAGNG